MEEKKTTELQKQLQQIADNEQVLVMSFVASDVGVRVSQASYYNTSITIQDLYEVEKHVNKLRDAGQLPQPRSDFERTHEEVLKRSENFDASKSPALRDLEAYLLRRSTRGH